MSGRIISPSLYREREIKGRLADSDLGSLTNPGVTLFRNAVAKGEKKSGDNPHIKQLNLIEF